MTNEPTKDYLLCHREMTHLRDDLWECSMHGIFNMPMDDEDDSVASSDTACPKMDSCGKMDMIRDKDILDSQAADAIRSVCGKCTEVRT